MLRDALRVACIVMVLFANRPYVLVALAVLLVDWLAGDE